MVHHFIIVSSSYSPLFLPSVHFPSKLIRMAPDEIKVFQLIRKKYQAVLQGVLEINSMKEPDSKKNVNRFPVKIISDLNSL